MCLKLKMLNTVTAVTTFSVQFHPSKSSDICSHPFPKVCGLGYYYFVGLIITC